MNPLPPPNHNHFWEQISTNALVRFLLFFASGWAFVELFRYFEYVIFVFTLAAVLALVLNYPVRYLEQFLRRSAALGIVIAFSLIAIVVLIFAIGVAITTQLQQLATALIQVLNTSDNPLDRVQSALAARNIPLNLEAVEDQIRNTFVLGLNWAISSLPALVENYVTFIIILVIAFFMLADGEKIWQLALKTIPAPQRSRFAIAVQKNFTGFLQGQLLISLSLTIATFLVFVLFQIPFSFLLAVIIGVFDLVPGIGATLGVSLVCLIILVQSGWVAALKVLVVCIVLQQLQDNLMAPRIMQSTVHLNPIIVFFALLVGTRMAGFLGVFLSIPIAGVIVSLLEIEEVQSS